MPTLRVFLAVVAGLLAGVLLQLMGSWYSDLILAGPDQAIPATYALLRGPLVSLQAVAPGFVAGFLARRGAWTVGAAVGVLTWLVDLLAFGDVPVAMLANPLNISLALGAVIVSAVAAAAGLLVANRQTPPNNSFEPKPLRGSA